MRYSKREANSKQSVSGSLQWFCDKFQSYFSLEAFNCYPLPICYFKSIEEGRPNHSTMWRTFCAYVPAQLATRSSIVVNRSAVKRIKQSDTLLASHNAINYPLNSLAGVTLPGLVSKLSGYFNYRIHLGSGFICWRSSWVWGLRIS